MNEQNHQASAQHSVSHATSEILVEAGHFATNQRFQNMFRLAAALTMVGSAGYGLARSYQGDAVFSLVGSILLFLSLVPDDLAAQTKRIAGIVVNTSLIKVYENIVYFTRHGFQYGDPIVRGIMVVLTIGGTALVCKYGIKNFNMLPPYLDLAFKRLGPGLAIISLVLYPTSSISKRIFALSTYANDLVVRKYEFRLYVSVILFSLTVLILFGGFPMEGVLPLRPESEPTTAPGWTGLDTPMLLVYVSLIWLIRTVGSAACIVSRLFEWTWREKAVPGR